MAATTRTLRPTAVRELTSGEGSNGRAWTLYAVEAVDAAGAPIRAELRAFEKLPVDELVELEVERRDDARGVTYTLRCPRTGSALGGRVAALERRVEHLEELARQPTLA